MIWQKNGQKPWLSSCQKNSVKLHNDVICRFLFLLNQIVSKFVKLCDDRIWWKPDDRGEPKAKIRLQIDTSPDFIRLAVSKIGCVTEWNIFPFYWEVGLGREFLKSAPNSAILSLVSAVEGIFPPFSLASLSVQSSLNLSVKPKRRKCRCQNFIGIWMPCWKNGTKWTKRNVFPLAFMWKNNSRSFLPSASTPGTTGIRIAARNSTFHRTIAFHWKCDDYGSYPSRQTMPRSSTTSWSSPGICKPARLAVVSRSRTAILLTSSLQYLREISCLVHLHQMDLNVPVCHPKSWSTMKAAKYMVGYSTTSR